MKKFSNNTAMALLRGAIVLAGSMTTVVTMLFCTSIYGIIATTMIGGIFVALITEMVR